MRVTPTTMFLTMDRNLQLGIGKVQDAQERLSSGKKINRLSDSPTDAATVLGLAARERDWSAYTKAADDATGWLDTQDQALQSASSLLRRARDLTVSAGNSTMTPEGREAIATELTGIRDDLASLANTTYLGRSVFGGFQPAAVAQDATTGAWNWSGGTASDAVNRRVAPEVTVQVNLDGNAVFGFAGGNDVFSVLDGLATDIRAGNPITTGLSDLDARLTDVGVGLATVGGRTNQVEAARATGLQRVDTIKQYRSALEDADIAESVMDLQMAENGYQAVLGAVSRLSMPSLLDFLR
jgi:flagellar hook-associated protein 3 FlgL